MLQIEKEIFEYAKERCAKRENIRCVEIATVERLCIKNNSNKKSVMERDNWQKWCEWSGKKSASKKASAVKMETDEFLSGNGIKHCADDEKEWVKEYTTQNDQLERIVRQRMTFLAELQQEELVLSNKRLALADIVSNNKANITQVDSDIVTLINSC